MAASWWREGCLDRSTTRLMFALILYTFWLQICLTASSCATVAESEWDLTPLGRGSESWVWMTPLLEILHMFNNDREKVYPLPKLDLRHISSTVTSEPAVHTRICNLELNLKSNTWFNSYDHAQMVTWNIPIHIPISSAQIRYASENRVELFTLFLMASMTILTVREGKALMQTCSWVLYMIIWHACMLICQ